jgi:6-phosphogluconolactonase
MNGGTFAYLASGDTQEIFVFGLDPDTGELRKVDQTALAGPSPSLPMTISPDRRFLYAGQRAEPFSVAVLTIDGFSGKLTLLGYAPLLHQSPYLSTDRTGRWLLSASYAEALVSVSPIGLQGYPQPPHQVIRTEANPHSIQVDTANRHAFVPSLGGDVFLQWNFDAVTGRLSPNAPASVRVAPGAGPRHFAFHPINRTVYLLNELDASLYVYAYDASSGTLRQRQVLTALPPDFDGPSHGTEGVSTNCGPKAADIHCTPDGRYLYASERTTNSLAAFSVDINTGMVERIGSYATEESPRSFNIDPSGRYLLAIGELSNHLSCYSIGPENGNLSLSGRYPVGRNLRWVEIIRLP